MTSQNRFNTLHRLILNLIYSAVGLDLPFCEVLMVMPYHNFYLFRQCGMRSFRLVCLSMR